MKIIKKLSKESWYCLIILILFICVLIRWDLVKPLEFDSSYNLLMVRTWLREGVYGTDNYILPGKLRFSTDTRFIVKNKTYVVDPNIPPSNKIYPFDTWITTGYPVLAPIAFFAYLFGFNYLISRIVMNLFAIAFVLVVWKILLNIFQLNKYKKELLLSVIGMSFIFHLDGYMVHTLGEIPTFVFLLLSFLMSKKSPFFTGILLSLAFLTKNIMIYVCLPYFIFCLYEYAKEKSLNKIFSCLAGFSIPFIILLLWITQYYSLNEYTYLLSETLQRQLTPFSFSVVNNPLTKILSFIKFDAGSLIFMTIFIFLFFARAKFRSKESLAMVCMFGYFIFFYSENVSRHTILFKYILSLLLVHSLIIYFLHDRKEFVRQKIQSVAMVFFFITFALILPSLQTQPELFNQKKIAYYINSQHASDTFYFYNWWNAPGIQLLTNKSFIFLHPSNMHLCKKRCYLIVEPDFKKFDPTQYRLMIDGFPAPSYTIAGYDFYEIHTILPSPTS